MRDGNGSVACQAPTRHVGHSTSQLHAKKRCIPPTMAGARGVQVPEIELLASQKPSNEEEVRLVVARAGSAPGAPLAGTRLAALEAEAIGRHLRIERPGQVKALKDVAASYAARQVGTALQVLSVMGSLSSQGQGPSAKARGGRSERLPLLLSGVRVRQVVSLDLSLAAAVRDATSACRKQCASPL